MCCLCDTQAVFVRTLQCSGQVQHLHETPLQQLCGGAAGPPGPPAPPNRGEWNQASSLWRSRPEPLGDELLSLLCLQETVLCCLMEMAAAEGKHPPLDQDQDLDWSEHFSFPRELIRVGPHSGRAAGAHPLGGVGGVSAFGPEPHKGAL